jgi:hypothetical protein
MKATLTKALIWIFIAAASMTATAGERSITTLGTVKREISADRTSMTLEVTARESTIEESNKKLEQMLKDLQAEVIALNYPTNALTLKFRVVRNAREWNSALKKYDEYGFDSSATFSVLLVGLTNWSAFLTYIGTHDGMRVAWQTMGSSSEGEARKEAIPEALRAARAKAELLAAEGGAKVGKVLEVTEEQVETREFNDASTWGGNTSDPREGTGAFPMGVFVRVRAKFELKDK